MIINVGKKEITIKCKACSGEPAKNFGDSTPLKDVYGGFCIKCGAPMKVEVRDIK